MTINEEVQSIKQRFGIIGNAATLNHAVQIAIQVAPTDMTVLITGESGSGKESFSKIIHSLSVRKHGQFIAINCGAIPEGTIDSELFGHEKGSFTGAHEARKGYFEVTNGGTIFLDEIGEMPLSTQARLLRVLENGEFIKVGASKVLKTDVRVVAATNVNLYDAVQKGRFREDLYYRLNTVPIYVPPLREREADIDLLFKKFAGDFSEKYRMSPVKLNEEAKAELMRFRFPGNIRQLKNLVEQISVLAKSRDITKEVFLQYLPDHGKTTPMLLKDNLGGKDDISERDILYKILFDMKRDMNELKKMVLEVAQNGGGDGQFVKEHAELFEELSKDMNKENNYSPFVFKSAEPKQIEIEKIEDVTHEPEEESLSIERKEKELILKALKKNKNKRKYAAQDLGISERTLYRKIKEYAIEE